MRLSVSQQRRQMVRAVPFVLLLALLALLVVSIGAPAAAEAVAANASAVRGIPAAAGAATVESTQLSTTSAAPSGASFALVPPGLLAVVWVVKAFLYLLFFLLLAAWWLQGQLLYMPSFGRANEGTTIASNPRGFRSPQEYGLRYEEVWLRSGAKDNEPGSGTPIHAWLILQPGAAASQAPTLLFFHGNAGNIGYRLPNLRALHHATGCNTLIVDYRGYGHSAGLPSEQGLIEDAQAALAFLRERGGAAAQQHGQEEDPLVPTRIDPARIHLFGRSLGGAVALQLAALDHEMLAQHPSPAPPPLAGVLVENSFSSLEAMVFVLAARMGLLRAEGGDSGEATAEEAEARANEQEQAGEEAAEAGEAVPIPSALPVGAGGPGGGSDDSGASSARESLPRRVLRLVLHVLMTSRWDSLSALGRMDPRTPVLFLSGLLDELVPAAHMAALHKEALRVHASAAAAEGAAPAEALRILHPIERGGHNDSFIVGGVAYYHAIARFFARAHEHMLTRLAPQQQQQESEADRQRRAQAAAFAAAINGLEEEDGGQ